MSSELPPNEQPKAAPTPITTTEANGFSGPIIGGGVLILIGVYFLLQNLGIIGGMDFNWWALFILIPAAVSANQAYKAYQANGNQFNYEARNKATAAAILLVVFSALMFDLDWGKLWPIFLIIGGIGIFLGGWGRQST